MIARSKHFRVTLEQLRIYKKQPKVRINPCSDKMMRLMDALEAAQGKINGPVYKYVKEVEQCLQQAKTAQQKTGSAGTLYYLSQYLDVGKFKKK
mmetsp:Transcript_35873/g.55800  ORF Transcript_35873/g.55800 Transcript_35873/m.55800 type:complete len:94 (-) Transcript_35873:58-339(-)